MFRREDDDLALVADAEGMHGLGEIAPQDHPDSLALEQRPHDQRLGLVTAAAYLHETGSRVRFARRSPGEGDDAGPSCHIEHASIPSALNMLEWWKDLIRPIRLVDSRFGNLRYLRDARFWEGRAAFAPTGTEVEVLISGHSSGPTEQQRIFFSELQERYNSLWAELHRTLAIEAQRVHIDTRTLVLACIDVPQAGSDGSDAEWALSYETQPPSWHFTVQMRTDNRTPPAHETRSWYPSEL